LAETCREAKISFLSTPYSIELADHIDPFVSAYKIGSGDVNYIQLISHIAATNKPWIIATGASSLEDVHRAVQAASDNNKGVLMQCNTNYTAAAENFSHLNLRVLESFRFHFPSLILGLSDHTLGHTSILGALALGARVFEKHFTDDNNRTGPDHLFSMNPRSWSNMIDASMDLFHALGDGVKRVEDNEKETVVLQRRCIRAKRDLQPGEFLDSSAIDFLRPAPVGSIAPSEASGVLGKKVRLPIAKGEHFTWSALS
jgi:N-acetylneuraminate synthase